MLELMKTFAASLAGVAAIAATQLFLTPQQTGIAVAAVLIIVLFSKVDKLSKRTSPTLNTNKKFRKAFFEGEPITPKHTPLDRGQYPYDSDDRFFAETTDFANEINYWMKMLGYPFRLEETHLASIDLGHDGREYRIYYNQIRVGKLELSGNVSFRPKPLISLTYVAEIKLDFVRLMHSVTVRGFLSLLATKIAGIDNQLETDRLIDRALLDVLWDTISVDQYSHLFDEPQTGDLNITLRGEGWADVLKHAATYGKVFA